MGVKRFPFVLCASRNDRPQLDDAPGELRLSIQMVYSSEMRAYSKMDFGYDFTIVTFCGIYSSRRHHDETRSRREYDSHRQRDQSACNFNFRVSKSTFPELNLRNIDLSAFNISRRSTRSSKEDFHASKHLESATTNDT